MHEINDNFIQQISGEFSIELVIISVILACVASYTALSLNERLKNNSFISGDFWITLAAVSMAFGIWSMHYMGMLAYSLPVKVEYSIFWTIVSMIPILLASFLAFYIVNLHRVTKMKSVISSLLIACGISSMHLIGMMSMSTELHHTYHPAGIFVAFLIPFLAFMLLTMFYAKLHKVFMRVLFGIVIGLAGSAAHYIMMLSMELHVSKDVMVLDQLVQHEHSKLLALLLLVTMLGLVFSLLIGVSIDYLFTRRIERVDTITHLPNSQQMIIDMQKHNCKMMALWTFDDFDQLNKTFGYSVGDIYIRQITERLKQVVPKTYKMYRTAQHQILLATDQKYESFREVQQQLAQQFAQPYYIEHADCKIIPKAICAISSNNDATNEELLKQVISISRLPNLMYDFSIIEYNAAEHSMNVQDEIIHNIDKAMLNDELFLVYQPKLQADKDVIVGVEALLRWHHSEYGFISPAIFVPLLEQQGKMGDVTNWVIEKVCNQIEDWKARGISICPVAINIPGDYLISSELKECLRKMVKKYDISPKDIELELTETSFVQNLEQAMRSVEYFNALGFGVALDDFGTGLSSLSYLRQMKITTLKVDKAFIDNVPAYKKDVAIAKTIIALGESLNLRVVVEGVETEEQLKFVMASCESPIIQGYYFSKPLTVYDLEQFVEKMDDKALISI